MKKLLVLLLTATLLISCVWLTASAAATDYVDAEGKPLTADATAVTPSTTTWSEEWYVVNGSVTITTRIEVSGDVNLILADGCTLDATNGGVHVPESSSLTIWAQSAGREMGQLKATSTTDGAGIGSDYGKSNGPITINGGIIEASGGEYGTAAGIGGGELGAGKNITISGGMVTASGGGYAGFQGAAGIGGGKGGGGDGITINGGTVTATGGYKAAGIGGGSYTNDSYGNRKRGDGKNITINGGTVTAFGGRNAAGIGGGVSADGSNITISGGNVTATGGDYGAGIGGGERDYQAANLTGGNGSYITVENGTVIATGGKGGAGIGGGYCSYDKQSGGTGSFITIRGGTVTATGTAGGAGIGGGFGYNGGPGNDITIDGGTVTANGSGYGAGIGGGEGDGWTGNGNRITVSGGVVEAASGNSTARAISAAPSFADYTHLTLGNATNNTVMNTPVEWTGNANTAWAWPWVKIQSAEITCAVTPATATVVLNGTDAGSATFSVTATATAGGQTYDLTASLTPAWSVAGGVEGTTISNGALTVAADERAATLTVTATVNGTPYTATVTVTQPNYTVAFNSDGGSAVPSQNIARYQKATQPTAPTRTGYDFDGWYNGDALYNFDSEVTGNLTLTAKWLEQTQTVPYVDAQGVAQTPVAALPVIATTTVWSGSSSTGGWYVANASVAVSGRIEVSGNVNLILADGATLTAGKGVHVPAGSTLTIWCQSGKSGALEATGGENQAGIGGNDGEGNGPIAINGGTVRATGGDKAAGIGGGRNADGVRITIRGGNVTARGSAGGDDGAGIGGGMNGAGKEITISGGTVYASTPKGGAGIGGGAYAKGADITISGGTVIATSGQYGAGIGGGYNGGAENITISGGDVKASGGYRTEYMSYSSGIGAGAYWNNVIGSATNIIITGGIVEAESGNTGGYAIGATPEFNGYSHLTYGNRSNTQSSNVVEYTGNPKSDWNGWSWVKIVPATFAFEMTMTPATVELNGTATATSAGAVGATATLADGAKVVLSSTSATWSVAPDGNGSTISSAGVLTVAADERAETLTVSAVVDGTTYTATVTVVQPDVTVTFDSDGGSAVSAQTVTRYQKATKPDNPARDGYAFDDWYTQAEGGDKWDFTAEVTANMTLYARWTEITIEGIELDKTALTLREGETATLTATVTPADAQDATVTWAVEPDDGSVVTITENADGTITITATGAGAATITATAGGLTATCAVTVSGPEPEEPTVTLTLDKTALTLREGETATVTATVTPAGETVTWTIEPEDGSVATIAALTRGLPLTGEAVTVTAVKAGTAIITASAGGLTATCAVTVLPAAEPETYTITLDANGGQIVSGTLKTGPDGKLTSLPTAAREGYVFDGWYTAREGGAQVTTDTVFTADMTIYARWSAVPQTGDSAPLALWTMLAALALGGLLAVKARR